MNQPTITLDDIGKRWGALLTQAFAQISEYEKQNAALLRRVAELEAQLEQVELMRQKRDQIVEIDGKISETESKIKSGDWK